MVDFNEFTQDLNEAVRNLHEKGAFLTVKSGEEVNTMTIGWGNVGFQWGKSIFTVLVRKQRHTFSMIDNVDNFTVTIPLDDSLKDEIKFCGIKSGRDYDKFKECDLELIPSKTVDTPVINKPNVLTYECKIVYKQEMNPEFLSEGIKTSAYPGEDYHVVYYGQVEACYKL
ncbi:MAG: flavin reductase family protein [Clostridium sp.]|uniref:flavin reductase family protein n=1 Tax=Clostridium sp. TaxID=1506 RepID=UPI003047DAE4